MYHLNFARKLSDKLQMSQSATSYNLLERYLKASIEDYICQKFINTDRQTIGWFTQFDPTLNQV